MEFAAIVGFHSFQAVVVGLIQHDVRVDNLVGCPKYPAFGKQPSYRLVVAIYPICALKLESEHLYLIGRFPGDEDVSLNEIWGGFGQRYIKPQTGFGL